ncbi:MAG: histidine kinase [Candidatus Dormibacteria bacterium]
MTSHRTRTLAVVAVAAAAVSAALGLTTIALAVATRAHVANFASYDAIGAIMPLTFAGIGGLIAVRRPQNPTGWLFLFIGIAIGLNGSGDQLARLVVYNHAGPPAAGQWGLWFSVLASELVWPVGAAALLLMLVPDGHLPSRRWRVVVAADIVLLCAVVVSSLLTPGPETFGDGSNAPFANPTAIPQLGALGGAGAVVYFAALALVVVVATAPFVKLRRARGDARQQVKWIAYAVLLSAVLAVALSVAALFSSSVGSIGATLAIALGFGVSLPVAAAIAIFKHGLYEIDIVISRTLVYATLAALITGVYVGIAVGIGELVGSGGKPNLGLSILATAIVALGFQPARERLQRVANRLVYGKRATPYQVLSEFSSQVAGSYAADEVLPRMARVLEEGTGADRSIVWLRSGGALHAAATWPVEESAALVPAMPMLDGVLPAIPGVTRAVEVRHQGELLGALSVEKRRGESLTPVEEKLLDDLAHQAGLVLKNVGLTADLQRRLEELRASRQRLVSAQDAERRRLERNLHDGAQQNLVALKVKLGLAEMLAGKDPEKAAQILQQLKGDTDEALETLRGLARGIYPPLLADKGLVTALESQARKATVPVSVEAEGIGRYSQDVEATAYFCVLEALQNVQKYAGASRATVSLHEDDGVLSFAVEDDGRGFDVAHVKKGSGLTNMQDRIDALGGAVAFEARAPSGTRVAGTVPALGAPIVAGS